MLLFGVLYCTCFLAYVLLWQRRESAYVRERLVERFLSLLDENPKHPDVQGGGVVYVMQHMNGPEAKEARKAFRAEQRQELAVAGTIIVVTPIAASIASIVGTI